MSVGMAVQEFDVRGRFRWAFFFFSFFFLHKRKKDLAGRDGKYTTAPLLIDPFRVEK